MRPFTTLTSRAIALPATNIDTDIIYPARFLLITEKQGLGRYAFYEWRHGDDGALRTDTPLNDPAYADAAILVAGDNFGCGSSREQAPWALDDSGIRVVISTSFGEIFYGNCFKNGMLPIVVDAAELTRLLAEAEAKRPLTVDLQGCGITCADGRTVAFTLEEWRREALLNGWDEVAMILGRNMPAVEQFETRQRGIQPWLWADA